MERDFSNDPDDYWRLFPDDQYAGGVTPADPRPPQSPDDSYTPDSSGTLWLYDQNATPPMGAPAGQEWFWNGNQWSTRKLGGTPETIVEPPVNPWNPPTGGFASSYDPSGFQWPTFNAPRYTPGPAFVAPKPFEFEAFKAPEFNDIFKDGSFIGRRDEGLKAIEHGAAAKGLSRLPNTLKALAGWNQDFASREYGNIYDRSANTWSMNRNNAADAYSTNYGISRDVWDRNEAQNLNAFDRNYRSAYDEFDFNQWKPAAMTFEDMYRRFKAELDANTALATGGD